jgi:hypothetical protein
MNRFPRVERTAYGWKLQLRLVAASIQTSLYRTKQVDAVVPAGIKGRKKERKKKEEKK